MSTKYYKSKTEATKGFCHFHQARTWIPGRKARAGLQLPLPGGGSALQHRGCSSSRSWRCCALRNRKQQRSQPQQKQPLCSQPWCASTSYRHKPCSLMSPSRALPAGRCPWLVEEPVQEAEPLGSALGPPGHPCALSWSMNPVSTDIPEHIQHKESKSTQQAARSPSVWMGEEHP